MYIDACKCILYMYVGDAETSSLSFGRFLNTWARGDITGRRT